MLLGTRITDQSRGTNNSETKIVDTTKSHLKQEYGLDKSHLDCVHGRGGHWLTIVGRRPDRERGQGAQHDLAVGKVLPWIRNLRGLHGGPIGPLCKCRVWREDCARKVWSLIGNVGRVLNMI